MFSCIRLFRLLIVDSLFYHFLHSNETFAFIGFFLIHFCSSDFPFFHFEHTANFHLKFTMKWFSQFSLLLFRVYSTTTRTTARSSSISIGTNDIIFTYSRITFAITLLLNSHRSSLETNRSKSTCNLWKSQSRVFELFLFQNIGRMNSIQFPHWNHRSKWWTQWF